MALAIEVFLSAFSFEKMLINIRLPKTICRLLLPVSILLADDKKYYFTS
jgi:hypothetical protein